jgi:type I restriction-modification system DNA methylase subunit
MNNYFLSKSDFKIAQSCPAKLWYKKHQFPTATEGKEYRTLKLYGQEVNLITSAIARMNMFMHGIEEFSIVRGDTLAQPAFLENDTIKKFNVILANPPYSIKAWDRKGDAVKEK